LLSTFHARRLIVSIRKSCRCNDEHTCCHQQPSPPPTMPWRGAHIKNPQGLTDPEDCTRNSSSPVPQPSRERWSILQAGLLAHGSPYSPCLPIIRVKRETSFVNRLQGKPLRFTRYASRPTPLDSGIHGFRPHLQRRDREGLAPSSLTQESYCGRHSRRPGRRLSRS